MLNFSLEVLSPVHIGSGERITKWEYTIKDNFLEVYPYQHLIAHLLEKNPAFLQNLRILMQNKDFSLSMLKELGVDVGKPLYRIEIVGSLKTNEVELFIKSLGMPYIPGSELKGALRTAYMGGLLLVDKELRDRIRLMLRQKVNNKGELEKFGSKGKGFEESFFNPVGNADAKYDLFKAIAFPDLFFELRDLCVEVPKMIGSDKSLYACESIKVGTRLEGKLLIERSLIDRMIRVEKLNYKHLDLSWDRLKELSNSFYSLVLDMEMEFFRNMPEVRTHLQEVKRRMEEGILLRIGKHQGYLSTTIMAVFKKEDPELFERVYDASVSQSRKEKPKTRRISSKNLTFGWVLIKRV